MSGDPVTVSVVIPTHQRADMVSGAIASVLAQIEVDLEVIVVDDGSSDGTATVVCGLAQDTRVRYVWQANAGRSAARNRGLALARGRFVGFLDSDDQLEPGALAAHLKVHAEHPDLGMSVAGYVVVDEHGVAVDERLPWLTGGSLDLADWLFDCYGMPGSVLHRREWLERVGGFDAACEIAEDWDLYLRMASAGCPMAFVGRATCRYRQHDQNSIRDLKLRWRASRKVVERVFARAGLPSSVRALEQSALAWVDVVAARRGFLGGDHAFASARLEDALARDPALTSTHRRWTMEYLLAPEPGGKELHGANLRAIARALGATPREVRVARADSHMARFFVAAQRARWPAARRSLVFGLLSDPRWLLNRGVLKLGMRSLFGAARPSRGSL